MKPFLLTLTTAVLGLIALTAIAALAQEVPPPSLGEDVGALVDAVRTGQAIVIAGTVITLLVNLFKQPWLGGLTKKIPARWRIVIPIVLGGVAGILMSIAGGVPWMEALMVGLFSGPAAVFGHEVVVEALLGRSASRNNPPKS